MTDVLVTITDLSENASGTGSLGTVDVALGAANAVDSVNGHTGTVVLAASDVGAQPVDSDLTAIAALSTTTFGRGLLALADAASLRTTAGLGSAATQATSAFDAAGAAAAAQAASQPLDTDLTAIAALATTTFGRSLLTAADAAAARATLGAGTSSLAIGTTSSTAKAGDYQPASTNISDASTIGKSVLTAANAAAARTAIGLAAVASTGAYSDLTGRPNFPWIQAKDYGVVADGTTDDTTAMNAAHAAFNSAGGGWLIYPRGTIKTTGNLTATTAPGTIQGTGTGNCYDTVSSTVITTSSNSTPLLTIGGHATTVRGLALKCVAGTTSVSGSAGILVTAGDGNRYEDLTTDHFYIDIDVQDGAEWYMAQCFFYDPVKYGLKIRHVDLPDGGDMVLEGCQFIAVNTSADAAIRQESGGGLKLIGSKINYRSSAQFAIGLDIAVVSATGVLTVIGNSFENVGAQAIRGTGTFQSAVITGNQFGYYASKTVPAIDISGWNDVTVVGNTFMNTNGCTAAAVLLTSVTNGAVGLNSWRGFASEYTLTSCTGITTLGGGGFTDPTTTKGDLIVHGSSTTRLGVGSDGQVLTADSAQTAGVKWATPTSGFADPTTTKGDLITHGTTTGRKAVGSNGTALIADSTQTDGLIWRAIAESDVTNLTTDLAAKAPLASPTFTGTPAAPTPAASDNSTKLATTSYVDRGDGLLVPKSVVTTKGDLLVASGSAAVARLGVGADGTVLTADAASTNGVKWAAAAGGGGGGTITTARYNSANTGSSPAYSSGTFIDLTNHAVSIAAAVGDVLEITLTGGMFPNNSGNYVEFQFAFNGTRAGPIWKRTMGAVAAQDITLTLQHVVISGDLSSGSVPVKVQLLTNGSGGITWLDETGFTSQLAVKNLLH